MTIRSSSSTFTLANLAVVVALFGLGACTDDLADEQEPSDADPSFTKAEWASIASLSPESLENFGPPADPSNAWSDDVDAARLGHRLFFDCRLGDVAEEVRSCATCHAPEYAFSDDGLRRMDKDITSVLNIAQYDYHTAIGKFDSLWSMPIAPTENGFLNTDRLAIAKAIANGYAAAYLDVFGDEDGASAFMERAQAGEFDDYSDWTCSEDEPAPCNAIEDVAASDVKGAINRIYANYGKSLAAYMRRITSGPSRFDAYVHGGGEGFNDSEREGLRLFINEGNCVKCHEGPQLTDNEFHDIGLAAGAHSRSDALEERSSKRGTAYEFGRGSIYNDDPSKRELEFAEATLDDEGAYRTPGLRDVSRTAPYMHTAEFDTLFYVVQHYNNPPLGDGDIDMRLGWPLGLSDGDAAQIVDFLETLDGDLGAIDDEWMSVPQDVPSDCRLQD